MKNSERQLGDLYETFTIVLRVFSDTICTINHMFGRVIWDKLAECIFENFEVARAKRGQNFQKLRG